MLVDLQHANLGFQRRPRDSEPSGRTRWTSHATSARRERSLDPHDLVRGKVVAERLFAFSTSGGSPHEPTLVDRQNIRFREDHGSLDDVLQLADIAGPRVRTENAERLLTDSRDLLARAFGEAADEILGE